MRIDISFAWNESIDSDLTPELKDILRNSYDYQKDRMDLVEEDDNAGNKIRTVVIYPELCAQSKRTEETLNQIVALITKLI